MGRKERYVLAMALLLVIGLSAAWAAESSMVKVSFSVDNFPSVTASNPSIQLSGLKKNVWFYKQVSKAFTINSVPGNLKLWVRVGVWNMAQLADDFKALDINVTLKGYADTKVVSDVISLGAGTSSVLLYLNTNNTGGTFNIDLYISGSPTTTSPDSIMLYCAIEPAIVVQPS